MSFRARARRLELWGGTECTVARVGDAFYDQIERTGHGARLDDLDRFAELGVSALRQPVLWERTAPDGLEHASWGWPDERLGRLRELGMRPIVGLVHHGSGPRSTSLLDPAFPERLAEYARAVAARYPWVEAYTPVNEPLTTARFSALYGHWYPHLTDDRSFAVALLAQVRATVLAMRAIREVRPEAQLVQTEDLGKTHSTPSLAYQAEFENERRWITWDLLCGRVDREHRMWQWLTYVGIEPADLEWFLEHTCPPDLIGINTYLTSERFLDERIDRYPEASHGGNGGERYADVEAVRVRAAGADGVAVLLGEAWERFGLPLAITEAHLGCTREEQLRWLDEVWREASAAREAGADVRAVTLWMLLGAYDWDSLLTRARRRYEPGVFDLRSPEPRATALAAAARTLSAGDTLDHPVLASPGWWRRADRLTYPPAGPSARQGTDVFRNTCDRGGARPLLITGATGTLGGAFSRLCDARGLEHRLLTRAQLDIADPESVERALDAAEPWAIVNTAGYVRVDDAETDQERCFRENADGPAALAEACARHRVALVTFSSDLVFDGAKGGPYVESDQVAPLNVYGRSKAEGELRVLDAMPEALVVRTSAFFGPWDEWNFVTLALRALGAGDTFEAADDSVVSPTYVPDLVHATLDLLIDGAGGIWHLASDGAVTWASLARYAAVLARVDASTLEPRATEELGLAAARPAYSALTSERAQLLPSLGDALKRHLAERETTREAMRPARV